MLHSRGRPCYSEICEAGAKWTYLVRYATASAFMSSLPLDQNMVALMCLFKREEYHSQVRQRSSPSTFGSCRVLSTYQQVLGPRLPCKQSCRHRYTADGYLIKHGHAEAVTIPLAAIEIGVMSITIWLLWRKKSMATRSGWRRNPQGSFKWFMFTSNVQNSVPR
jgi:hypothetical protein